MSKIWMFVAAFAANAGVATRGYAASERNEQAVGNKARAIAYVTCGVTKITSGTDGHETRVHLAGAGFSVTNLTDEIIFSLGGTDGVWAGLSKEDGEYKPLKFSVDAYDRVNCSSASTTNYLDGTSDLNGNVALSCGDVTYELRCGQGC